MFTDPVTLLAVEVSEAVAAHSGRLTRITVQCDASEVVRVREALPVALAARGIDLVDIDVVAGARTEILSSHWDQGWA